MLQTQKKDAQPKRFYTYREVSRVYFSGHYSEKNIRKLYKAGRLKAARINGRVLFDIRDLDAFVESCKGQ